MCMYAPYYFTVSLSDLYSKYQHIFVTIPYLLEFLEFSTILSSPDVYNPTIVYIVIQRTLIPFLLMFSCLTS